MDVKYRCMKPTCSKCWLPLLNKRVYATRKQLKKIGIKTVWVGKLSSTQRSAARSFKNRNKDRTDLLVMNMLTTAFMTTHSYMIATCNMLPTMDVLKELPLESALSDYHAWCSEYRPKRVTSDWDLTVKGTFTGRFTASEATINEMWGVLGERWGHKAGDIPPDTVAFERRMFTVLEEIRERKRSVA